MNTINVKMNTINWVLVTILAPALAAAATLPAGFSEALVGSGLSAPTAMALAPDGRLFVCEQGGSLRIIKNNSLLAAPFVSVAVDSAGERGLLGVALDPNFTLNQYVYIYFTAALTPRHNRIVRYTANGDSAAPGSDALILQLNDLSSATNHNGGSIHFGPDGKLYVAVGENAIPSHSQDLGNLLGKILRIDPDGSIPIDNPFYGTAAGVNRAIWALGLRNPFTFAFQRGTGRMFINDVGEGAWEEINDGIAGSNYGWPATEGPTANPAYRAPLYAYGHATGPFAGCAITGGSFYSPSVNQFPSEFSGTYFFADYCGGWINRFDPSSGNVTSFASGISFPVDLTVSPDGSLFYLARGMGSVFKVSYSQTAGQRSKVGIYNSGRWQLDIDGSGAFESGSDHDFLLGLPGTPVVGDWNGDGRMKAGVYSNGYWFLDYDANGVWDGGVVDKLIGWGWTGAVPIVGDWNGDGKTKLGVYSNGFWFLDANGDYLWDGGVVDKQVGWGWTGVTPIVGDWNGNGKTKIGVYSNGFWFLDYDGSWTWDGGVTDKQVGWGWAGATPIIGDWNGDGKTKIGVFAGGYWYLDYDGNYLWQYPSTDKIWALGWTGTLPVIGDWNGDGKAKAGVFTNGFWYLDYNGNGVFEGVGADRIYAFGQAGDVPVVGRW